MKKTLFTTIITTIYTFHLKKFSNTAALARVCCVLSKRNASEIHADVALGGPVGRVLRPAWSAQWVATARILLQQRPQAVLLTSAR